MPGLFSRKRAATAERSQVLKFVAWGAGEVLLIFLGITLAIWFENSAEESRERDLTQGLMVGIQQSLGANLEQLQENAEVDDLILASLDRVISHLDSDLPWNDSIGAEMEMALHWSSPFLSTSGYESLKQAGMYRVTDPALRSGIIALFESTYGLLVGDSDRAQWVLMESVLNRLWGDELVRTDDGGTQRGLVAPRDLAAARASGRLRTALLEHQGFLLNKRAYTELAIEETSQLEHQLNEALNEPG